MFARNRKVQACQISEECSSEHIQSVVYNQIKTLKHKEEVKTVNILDRYLSSVKSIKEQYIAYGQYTISSSRNPTDQSRVFFAADAIKTEL